MTTFIIIITGYLFVRKYLKFSSKLSRFLFSFAYTTVYIFFKQQFNSITVLVRVVQAVHRGAGVRGADGQADDEEAHPHAHPVAR